MQKIERATIVSMRRDRKGFKLEDDIWYTTYTPMSADIERGDVVTFNYEKKGNFHNIKGGIEKVTGEGEGTVSAPQSSGSFSRAREPYVGFPVPVADKGRAIIRQNALTNAVTSVLAMTEDKVLHKLDDWEYQDRVIKLARYFEAYSTGDIDTEIGQQMAKEAQDTETASEEADS